MRQQGVGKYLYNTFLGHAPWPLWPLFIPLELVGALVKPFALAIRLFANMMAGHMMLKVMAGFVVMLGVTAGWLPLVAMVGLMGLELLVAALQADATGTVKDFKVTDGKGIGVVVELANGTTTWFFDDEITAA